MKGRKIRIGNLGVNWAEVENKPGMQNQEMALRHQYTQIHLQSQETRQAK
jgi:hypothetical protein